MAKKIYEVKKFMDEESREIIQYQYQDELRFITELQIVTPMGMIPQPLPIDAKTLDEAFNKYDSTVDEYKKLLDEKIKQQKIQTASLYDLQELVRKVGK